MSRLRSRLTARRRTPTVYWTENFTGSNGAAWSSDWTIGAQGGSATIQSNEGTQTTPATAFTPGPTAYRSTMPYIVNGEYLFDVRHSSTSSEQYCCFTVRSDGVLLTGDKMSNNGYYVNLRPMWIEVGKAVGGVRTNFATMGFTNSTTISTRCRISLVGGVFRVKAWLADTTEPTIWNIWNEKDSSPYLTAGKVFLVAHSGSSATARTARWDNITVTSPISLSNPPGPSTPNNNLFFAKNTNVVSTRKVFPHYFGQHPRSKDNTLPLALGGTGDYYDTAYLDVSGEASVHAAYGGFWRDRPLPRAVISGDYELEDLKWEIQTAQEMGAAGFFCNIINVPGSTYDRYKKMVDAANDLGTGFKVVPMLDTSGNQGSNATTAASNLAYFWGKASTWEENNKLMLGSFAAESWTDTQWTDIFAAVLAATGKEVSFISILNNANQTNINRFAAITNCDYAGQWFVGADPAMTASTTNQAGQNANWARLVGLKWFGSGQTQVNVPYTSHYFDEAVNSGALRGSWSKMIRDSAEHVQSITWCDFGEGGMVTPSVAKGYAQWAITAYHLEKWRTGFAPPILTECVFISHRDQPLTGATYQSAQTQFMTQTARSAMTTLQDKVEILTYLKEPATVTVSINNVAQTPYTAPAGEYAQYFDNVITTGSNRHSVTVVRDGTTICSVTSPFPVTNNPISQDRQYFFASSLHGTTQQYYPLMRL